jgi:hypothetical protein
VRCSQLTAKGTPCRNWAVEGSDRCVSHLRMTGPKSGLTPQLAEKLAQMIAAGNHTTVACAALGIAKSTFYDWWARGDPTRDEPRDAGFRAFRERIEQAKAEGEAQLVLRIRQDATRNVQSAIWLLERTHPERWARVSQREAVPSSSDQSLEEAADPFAEFDELAEARRRRVGGR